jgi:hypothetical protein
MAESRRDVVWDSGGHPAGDIQASPQEALGIKRNSTEQKNYVWETPF